MHVTSIATICRWSVTASFSATGIHAPAQALSTPVPVCWAIGKCIPTSVAILPTRLIKTEGIDKSRRIASGVLIRIDPTRQPNRVTLEIAPGQIRAAELMKMKLSTATNLGGNFNNSDPPDSPGFGDINCCSPSHYSFLFEISFAVASSHFNASLAIWSDNPTSDSCGKTNPLASAASNL